MSTIERPKAPEQRTIDVDVRDLDTRGRTVVGYAAVYGELSNDLGGFRERIAPGAFASVLDADVRALLNHDPNEVLGRTKSGTLRLADEQRGLRFELDLPDSPLGENVRAAVKRGDLDGASFRFVVGDETWKGDVRTVTAVKELHDITLATYPAYPAASVELRTRPQKETPMSEDAALEREPEEEGEAAEERTSPTLGGALRVIELNQGAAESRTLLGSFRAAGFKPGARTEITWDEYEAAAEQRSLSLSGTINPLNQLQRESAPYGFDRRYAWPAFPSVGVDSGVTSVQVLSQTARTLPTAASVVRLIDATSNKPEVGGTVAINTVPLSQVAAVQSGIPNIYLEQEMMGAIIGTDLRLAVNEGLDKIVIDTFAASGFSGTANPMLVNIRNAIETIQANGYQPDTVILTPAVSAALDVLVTGISGGTNDYVFGAGRFAPGELFGLRVRVSKTVAAPVVVDASAYGRLYVSPISLATFEENAGKTNTSLVRLEGHAAFGVERQTAAIRIAAS